MAVYNPRGSCPRNEPACYVLAMRDFTLSSAELAAERFPRDILSTTPSITSKRELSNSYCTLFPLKLKELEALVSVFSFFSWDCVAASFSSKSRLNAENVWSNLVSKVRRQTNGPVILKQSHEQDLSPGRIQRSKRERSLVQYQTA